MRLLPTKLEFKLNDKGIYMLGCGNGAEGKTYVHSLIEQYNNITGDKNTAWSITYQKDVSKNFYIEAVTNYKGCFFLLDRVDTYLSKELLDSLKYGCKAQYILIDCKCIEFWRHVNCHFSEITINKDNVLVEQI